MLGVPYFLQYVLFVDSYVSFGCESTFWIDSAMLPVQPLEPMFHRVEMAGAVFLSDRINQSTHLLPATRNVLHALTGTDSIDSTLHIPGGVLGFQLSSPLAFRFVQRVYQFAALGTPFLSCYPNEFVHTHLFLMPDFQHLLTVPLSPPLALWGPDAKSAFFKFLKGRR